MDFSVQLHLVAAGVGVALIPELTIEHLPDGVELVILRTPVTRTRLLAARTPSLADPGVQNLAATIENLAIAQLTARHYRHPALR